VGGTIAFHIESQDEAPLAQAIKQVLSQGEDG